jgi:hypothetical protein
MIVQMEVDETGLVRVSDPELRGKKIFLAAPEQREMGPEGKTNWEEIWKIFQEADALDIPHRSPEEIQHDLRAFRESGS